MEISRQPILRTPILLLALADLVLLAIRLWPWQQVMNLPGNGTTGVDPAIALAGYIGLIFWISTAHEETSRKALFSAAWLGVFAGLLLVIDVFRATRPAADNADPGTEKVHIILLAGAAMVVGFAALRAARAGFATGFAAVCAIWASMTSCLIGVAAVLAKTWLAAGSGETTDPWKDYQGLAIGTPAMQALVHSLYTISGLLLIGPIVGCLTGTILASLAKAKK